MAYESLLTLEAVHPPSNRNAALANLLIVRIHGEELLIGGLRSTAGGASTNSSHSKCFRCGGYEKVQPPSQPLPLPPLVQYNGCHLQQERCHHNHFPTTTTSHNL